MTVVSVLRELWRYRRLVIAGAIVALVFQVMLVYNVSLGIPPKLESRQYNVGVASGAVLIDSQSSQAVDLGGGEGEVKVDVASLSARAQLLANLLVTRPLRDEIAKGAGVAPDRMITELSSTTEPGGPPPEASDVEVRPDDPDANIVKLQTSETVPIITINAQAPTEQTAARLAESTVSTLRGYLDDIASSNAVPDARKLVMRPLGEPTSAESLRGPRKSHAALVFLLLVGFWCAVVLGMSALARAWRYAAANESWNRAGTTDEEGIAELAFGRPSDTDGDGSAAPDAKHHAPRADTPGGVRERADDKLWLAPTPDTVPGAGRELELDGATVNGTEPEDSGTELDRSGPTPLRRTNAQRKRNGSRGRRTDTQSDDTPPVKGSLAGQ